MFTRPLVCEVKVGTEQVARLLLIVAHDGLLGGDEVRP